GPPLPGQMLAGLYIGALAPPGGLSFAQMKPLLLTGGVMLALVIPVGTVFGLLSTRREIRRIKRLAEVTGTVAGGDFHPRGTGSGGGEIGPLEDAFNRVTGPLSTARCAPRGRAGARPRAAGRAPNAPELPASVSPAL